MPLDPIVPALSTIMIIYDVTIFAFTRAKWFSSCKAKSLSVRMRLRLFNIHAPEMVSSLEHSLCFVSMSFQLCKCEVPCLA